MIKFHIPTKLIIEEGIITTAGRYIRDFGERVFLISDATAVAEAGYLNALKDSLEVEGLNVIPLPKVYPDSKSDLVNKLAEQARYSRSNVIVGFGSRNTINLAKAVAHLVSNGGTIEEYLMGKKSEKKTVAYVEIPSTFGYFTGITNFFVIRDQYDNTKKLVAHANNYADLIIIDPRLYSSIPRMFAVAIGLEILAVSIEAFTSKLSTPIAEAFALRAIELVGKKLPSLIAEIPSKDSSRMILAIAGTLASMALANSSLGITMALGMALNAVYGIHQATAVAIMLPYVMEFLIANAANKYVHVAKAMGIDISNISIIEAAIKAVETIRKIAIELQEIPMRLSDIDIDKSRFDTVAHIARNYPFVNYAPRVTSKEELTALLTAAY